MSDSFEKLKAGNKINVPHTMLAFSMDDEVEINSASETKPASHSQKLAGTTMLSNDNVDKSGKQMLRSVATNELNGSAEKWLNRFGTARVQLNFGEHEKFNNSSADLLLPLYDNNNAILFTQLGMRNKDSRNTLNLGAGVRTFHNNWMYGMNTFLDNDVTGTNRRVGLGAEAWTDYLKLSANNYFGITDWHQSRDFTGYNERPADGYDVRAEAYLPSYPQIGGKMVYEKYRGENVALFGKDNQQKNPYAMTVGMNYTPIPLFTTGIEHRSGKGGKKENSVNVQINYRLGDSWQSNISQSALLSNRVLAGSRYDLVERNNNIVLDYQQQSMLHLTLPQNIVGNGGETRTVTAQVSSKYALERIEWDAATLVAAGGSLVSTSMNTATIILPPYKSNSNINTYRLTAFAYDIKGNKSNQAITSITVDEQDTSSLNSLTTATPNTVFADGESTSLIEIILKDKNNNPVSGVTDRLILTNNFIISNTAQDDSSIVNKDIHLSTITETSAGIYHATLTSGTQTGVVTITPTLNNVNLQAVKVNLILNPATVVSLTPNVNTAIADNFDTIVFTAVVRDSKGELAANRRVSFTNTSGTISAADVMTDMNGVASVKLTNSQVKNVTVTARVSKNPDDEGKDATVSFTVDRSTALIRTLESNKFIAQANNIDTIVFTAKVIDRSGHIIANTDVHFTTDGGTLSDSTVTTDDNGLAEVSLTSATPGYITVKAVVTEDPNGSEKSSTVNFR